MAHCIVHSKISLWNLPGILLHIMWNVQYLQSFSKFRTFPDLMKLTIQ